MLTLAHQIRKQFRTRITLCFFIYLFVFTVVTYCDLRQESKDLSYRMENISSNLGRYIISQVLIGNEKSIETKIVSLEHKYNMSIEWDRHGGIDSHLIRWEFPVSWSFAKEISALDNEKFGVVVFSGSFLDERAFTYNILVKISLLLLFMLMMGVILYPIALKIPKKLFLDPLLQILSLLKEDTSAFCESNVKMKTVELEDAKNQIISLICQVNNESRDAAVGKIALQVAHDIRSPIAALNVILNDESQLPIAQRELLNKVLFRISSIANELLNNPGHYLGEFSNTTVSSKSQLLLPIITQIIGEKKVQYGSAIQLDFSAEKACQYVFVTIDCSEFGRVLSNIINNAVEASAGKANININLVLAADSIMLTVSDNGCGIPKEIISKVLSRRFSSGKKNSSGMGLAYSNDKIKAAGGDIKITSTVGEGTSVCVKLPTSGVPDWFSDSVQVMSDSVVVIIDDDESVHQSWEKKLFPLKAQYPEIVIINFYDYSASNEYLAGYDAKRHHCFLIDYELGGSNTGLDLIRSYHLKDSTYLVTGKHFDASVQDGCVALGCFLIPKEMLGSYKVKIQ